MNAAPASPFTLITMMLPGPDRKRTLSPYHFRVTFRSPTPGDPGCVATWEVRGGREEYQISLERTEAGEMIWHCTCPDAVYHADYRHACGCKHVQGMKQVFSLMGAVANPPAPRARERAVA